MITLKSEKSSLLNSVIRWFVLSGYVALIFATVPFIPGIRKYLAERFGYGVDNAVYAVFAVAGIVSLATLVRKQRGRRLWLSLSGLACVCGAYAVVLSHMNYVVEKFHYLEYGFLSFLLVWILRRPVSDMSIYCRALLAVYCVGLGDEAFQHQFPARVGEIGDVWLNVCSGFLGLCATAASVPSWRPAALFPRKTIRPFLAYCMVALIATFLFVWHVHGFGYAINDPVAGTFYSGFDQERLVSVNSSCINRKPLPPATIHRYENEAFRHLQQRDFYDTNKFYGTSGDYYIDWYKARNENRILEKYYSFYLDSINRRWPVERDRGDPGQDLPWSSRVKSTVITKYTFKQVAAGTIFLAVVFCGMLVFAGRTDRTRVKNRIGTAGEHSGI